MLLMLHFCTRKDLSFEFVFDIILDCTDSNNGATDTRGYPCSGYHGNRVTNCGKYDDNDFFANEMCCNCKGSYISY